MGNSSGPYIVFLASTINGYEGTGRSLSLKLLQQLREQAAGSVKEDDGKRRIVVRGYFLNFRGFVDRIWYDFCLNSEFSQNFFAFLMSKSFRA